MEPRNVLATDPLIPGTRTEQGDFAQMEFIGPEHELREQIARQLAFREPHRHLLSELLPERRNVLQA